MRLEVTDDGRGPVYEVELDGVQSQQNECPSDDELARDFIGQHAKELSYCAVMGNWLMWNGHSWKPDDKLKTISDVREFLTEKASAVCGKNSKSIRDKARVMAVEWLARSDQRTAAVVAQFDADPWLLNTPSGMVNLKTGRLLPSDPQAFCTKATAVSPIETAQCPLWMKFLYVATEGDEDLVRYLQRMAGYGITGLIDEHALFSVTDLEEMARVYSQTPCEGFSAIMPSSHPWKRFVNQATTGTLPTWPCCAAHVW